MPRSTVSALGVLVGAILLGGCTPAEQGVRPTGPGLSEPANLASVHGLAALGGNADAMTILSRNGFVITGETFPNLYNLYSLEHQLAFKKGDAELDPLREKINDLPDGEWEAARREAYGRISKGLVPVLITTDAMLHAYDALLTDELERMAIHEAEWLAAWQGLLWEQLRVPKGGKRPAGSLLSDKDAVDLAALVAVGMKLMDPKWDPGDARLPDWFEEEVRDVSAGAASSLRRASAAWGRQVEYSTFRPRGIYTRSLTMQRYFRARTWWSVYPFRIENDRELRMALELARVQFGLPEAHHWHTLMLAAPAGLLGRAEDPSIQDLARLVFGAERTKEDVKGGAMVKTPVLSLPEVRTGLAAFKPAIRVGDARTELSKPGQAFGVYAIPRCYVFDSEVFTLTTEGQELKLRIPSGLDVMSALGSNQAARILLDASPVLFRRPLTQAIQTSRERLVKADKVAEVTRLTHVVLAALAEPAADGRLPPFARTDSYRRKSLQTALAGWAEHRHRWVLSAKEVSFPDEGGSPPIGIPPGFVEPNERFWQGLLDLAIVTHEKFLRRLPAKVVVLGKDGREEDLDVPSDGLDRRWASFIAMVNRCGAVARKQLAGAALSPDEERFVKEFPKHYVPLFDLQTMHNELTPQAIVADVARGALMRHVLHVGTGHPQAIYAIFPHKGRLWLAKGGVMTYREQAVEDGRTLTDEQWREGLGKLPQPAWTKDFCMPPRAEDAGAMDEGEEPASAPATRAAPRSGS